MDYEDRDIDQQIVIDQQEQKEGGGTSRTVHAHVYDYETDFFSSMTTYHGLIRIYNAEKWYERMFWFMIVLAAFILFMYQAGGLLVNLWKKPVITQIDFKLPPHGDGRQFPLITICNFNPINGDKIETSGQPIWNITDDDVLKYISAANLIPETLLKDNVISHDDLRAFHKSFKEWEADYNHRAGRNANFSYFNFFNQTGFTCDELVEACWFGSAEMDKADCCDSAKEVMADFGKCLQFDQLKLHRNQKTVQYLTGAQYGLTLLLNVKRDNMRNITTDFFDAGFKFIAHSREDIPRFSMRGHAVGAGQKVYASVSEQQLSMLTDAKWQKCIKSWEELRDEQTEYCATPQLNKTKCEYYCNYEELLDNYSYTADNCETNCLMNLYNNMCTCMPLRYSLTDPYPGSDGSKFPMTMPERYQSNAACEPPTRRDGEKFKRKPLCNPLQLADCMRSIIGQISGDTMMLPRKWSQTCRCDVSCAPTEYSIESSYSALPNAASVPVFERLYGATDEQYIRENYAMITIYIRKIYYEMHTQQKGTTKNNVLGTIGGSMGLFMGMSLVTLAEIMVFLVKTIYMTGRDIVTRVRRSVDARRKRANHRNMSYATTNGHKHSMFNARYTYEQDLSKYESVYDDPDWYKNDTQYRSMFDTLRPPARSRAPSTVIVVD